MQPSDAGRVWSRIRLKPACRRRDPGHQQQRPFRLYPDERCGYSEFGRLPGCTPVRTQDSPGFLEYVRVTNLPRKLGLFSAVAVLTGTTIGSGIFRSPAGVAAKVPDPKLFLAVWIVGGLCVLAGALTYAELAAAFPHTGGLFVYLREAFGRLPAFLFGWANLTIIRAAAAGAIATVFAEYMLRMFGISDVAAVHYVAAMAILLLAGFNSAGIKFAAGVQNVTASMKYFALVILVVASFLSGGNAAFPAQAVPVPSAVLRAREHRHLRSRVDFGSLGV
ncbi:MAG: hypothetical protein DMG14_25345 [Acidobacteria bacterium]|nr:MAG: hypothetical protein DMG14_25345 [Acidobacteriota bacterium]